MKTTIKFFTVLLLLACFAFHASAQTHYYVKISMVQAGLEGKQKLMFEYPSYPDSASYYTALKFDTMLDAIQKLEGKGYELISINPFGGLSGVTVTIAYMRRARRMR